MSRLKLCCALVTLIAAAFSGKSVVAQSFGVELHNNLMPASGGMAGASLARPQDLQSAINGNPATLTQFWGTHFAFGGGWVEPTYTIDQSVTLPAVDVQPYSGKSDTQGSALGAIGVSQDFSAMGLPATLGIGFMPSAGAGVDFRHIPNAGGTNAMYVSLDMIAAGGVDLTDRLSAGAALSVGTSFMDGPFVDVGGMTMDYAIRGTLGATYDVNCNTTLGIYYQTKKRHTFSNAVLFAGGTAQDLDLEHPENAGFGIANEALMDGRLLLAVDVLYKRYSEADFFSNIYEDQWAFQFGAQYAMNTRTKIRVGYAYNENPMRDAVLDSIGPITLPDGVPAVRYVQGQFAAISQHRVTFGVGRQDVLPGVDVDLMAGGMFRNSDQLGTTTAAIQGYWIGFGLTWHFGRGACRRLPYPNEW